MTGSLGVTWGGYNAFICLDFTVTMPDATYRILTPGGATSPQTYNIMTGNNAEFFGSAPVTSAAGRACAADTAGCSARINGFLAGATAQRAGLVYQISSTGALAGPKIDGAAVFTRNP